MCNEKHASLCWSDELARAILNSIPNDQIAGLRETDEKETRTNIELSTNESRDSLIQRSHTDATLRLAMLQTWRMVHADVVTAAQVASIDGPVEQCEAIMRQFCAEEILLELITDEDDDGWALARWTVENVKNDGWQRELAALLDRWSGKTVRPSNQADVDAAFRIVIFGGHPRDESKMNRRLFDNSPFDVRWKPCEKHRGSPDGKDLIAATAHADAVILVATMVSHNIMRIVKRFTQEHDIPLRIIPKATDQQLRLVLAALFPGVCLGSRVSDG